MSLFVLLPTLPQAGMLWGASCCSPWLSAPLLPYSALSSSQPQAWGPAPFREGLEGSFWTPQGLPQFPTSYIQKKELSLYPGSASAPTKRLV